MGSQSKTPEQEDWRVCKTHPEVQLFLGGWKLSIGKQAGDSTASCCGCVPELGAADISAEVRCVCRFARSVPCAEVAVKAVVGCVDAL